ncbi:MAG: hypothetical protein AB9828_03355 [Sphaerochaetaceae bacterium]
MKKALVVLLLVCCVVVPLSAAKYDKSNGIGLGVSLGYPVSGITAKYGMDDLRLVGTLGYDYGASVALEAGVQYDLTEFAIEDIPFYVNIGGTVAVDIGASYFGLALNIPVGVSYFLEEYPIELFLKIAPMISVIPAVGFHVGGAIGGLYYLDK